jgi:fructokinase
MPEPLLGAIEAGGTKFVCAIGTPSGSIVDEARIPTRSPKETMDDAIAFFVDHGAKFAAFGIGSFGPIDLRRESPTYGHITSTPKPGWGGFDIVGSVRRAFDVPVGFDTDVNSAAFGESRWGAAKGLKNVLYVTVGTGIGGGAIAEGSLLHGLVHPEMGHIRVQHDWGKDPFPGVCPYHGDCLEGLASGNAIEKRWGVSAANLPMGHPAFQLEAEYLALACATWICTLSPQIIVLGGGVMQPHVFPLLRERTLSLVNGYVDAPEILPPGLGNQAGVLGALALAARAAGLE